MTTNRIYGTHWSLAFGLPFVILCILVALAVSARGELFSPIAIRTEPVLDIVLPASEHMYEIQANDDLANKDGWVTLAVVSNGVYRGYLLNMPKTLFFRIQYVTNTTPVGTRPVTGEIINAEKLMPPMPSA